MHGGGVVVEFGPRDTMCVSKGEAATRRGDPDYGLQLRKPHDAAQDPLGLLRHCHLAARPRNLPAIQRPPPGFAWQLECPDSVLGFVAHPVPEGDIPIKEPEIRCVVVGRPELLGWEQGHGLGDIVQGGQLQVRPQAQFQFPLEVLRSPSHAREVPDSRPSIPPGSPCDQPAPVSRGTPAVLSGLMGRAVANPNLPKRPFPLLLEQFPWRSEREGARGPPRPRSACPGGRLHRQRRGWPRRSARPWSRDAPARRPSMAERGFRGNAQVSHREQFRLVLHRPALGIRVRQCGVTLNPDGATETGGRTGRHGPNEVSEIADHGGTAHCALFEPTVGRGSDQPDDSESPEFCCARVDISLPHELADDACGVQAHDGGVVVQIPVLQRRIGTTRAGTRCSPGRRRCRPPAWTEATQRRRWRSSSLPPPVRPQCVPPPRTGPPCP